MLQGFRAASQSWLGKIVVTVVFGLLIAGLAIFGIGDIFRGGGSNAVATVGSTQIPAESLRTAYQNQLQRLSRQSRRPITPDQAKALGLDRQVLAQLITEASLDQKTKDLGLRIPDSTVVRLIQEEPAFKGPNGAFDVNTFRDTLRQAGLTEQGFVQEQRAVAARLQLADAITAELPVSLAAREAIHRYTSERRAAAIVTLPDSAAGEIPAPTDEQVTTFYNERKGAFRAPEYRSVNLLVLDPATIAKPDAVTEPEARARYESEKTRFGTPRSARSSRSSSRTTPMRRRRSLGSAAARSPSIRSPPSAASTPRRWISAPSPSPSCSTRRWPTPPSRPSRTR